MLFLFRQVDPIRIILLLLIFLALKIPLLLWGYPMTIPELNWILLGEKCGGNITLYRDLWDTNAPLFALLFQLLENLFGASMTGYHVTANLLLFVEAIVLNQVLNSNGVFKEKTLFPALFFLLFTSLFFDFNALSPLIISLPLLTIVLNMVLQQFRLEQPRQYHYFIGVLLSLATLCYVPNGLFMAYALLALGLYASFDAKKAVLLVAGFFMPLLLAWAYYYIYDATDKMMYCTLNSLYSITFPVLFDWKNLMLMLMAPGALVALAMFAIISAGGYTNYQYRVIRMMLIWASTSLAIILISHQFTPFLLIYLGIPFAFFIAHLFQLVTRKVIAESLFFMGVVVMLIICFTEFSNIRHGRSKHCENYLVDTTMAACKNRRILVLGNNPSPYYGNNLAGPYLSFPLGKSDLSDLNDYERIGSLYSRLEKDKPEYIIDQEGLMPQILDRIPQWDKEYQLVGQNIYKIK